MITQSTKDKIYTKVTNGVDSTAIINNPDNMQITGVKDTIPNKLYGKDKNGHFVEYNILNKIINVPATTDTILIQPLVTNIVAPPTTIGSVYLMLPPSPIDGMIVTVKFSEQINAAHWRTTDSSTVKGLNNDSLILVGIEIKLYYDLATTTWY